ncbi:hypothetical protein CK510_21555 [Brunnivagina elsteri CCALA 953]|uniref:Colicin D immunity protein domain-containing protein n=1 Tax=Brunnivagina elsteri CCALA 953 TaxID=987040 RepID=A0A2A2TEA8_9CYAN|nr:hypothetical protein CK510_21555 [Calothrix elsteri CCALA 953]
MKKYIILLEDFLSKKIDTNKFEQIFLQIFKDEEIFYSEIEFQVLDKLFGDVDAYCNDPNLIEDPEFEITEEELRLSAKKTLDQLVELENI